MNTRAVGRLLLALGIVLLLAMVVVVRQVRVHERRDEILMIAALSVAAFFTICGLVATLNEPPVTPEEAEAVYGLPLREVRRSSINTILGIYIGVLAVIAGAIVGVVTADVGAGIQTFTYGAIVGGVLLGIGLLLGHRPVES